jgi:hypothetical protein
MKLRFNIRPRHGGACCENLLILRRYASSNPANLETLDFRPRK